MGTADVQVCQLKVTLKEVEPAVWRRIQVRRQVRLDRLHLIIQAAMGWTNSHLHRVRLRRADIYFEHRGGHLYVLGMSGCLSNW